MTDSKSGGSSIGLLLRFFGHPAGLVLLAVQFALVAVLLVRHSARDSDDGCLSCHSDGTVMEELGYPQFTVTAEEAMEQSRMPRTGCRDCHLGRGGTRNGDEAHEGMLRPLLLGRDGRLLERKGIMPSLLSSRDDPLRTLLPTVERKGRLRTNPKVLTVMWHDRSPETWGYDREISQKTCGRPDCHPDEVAQFDGTVMGSNFRQRSSRIWNDAHGPNNCGPSFADVAPDIPAVPAEFSDTNTKRIADDLNVPLSYDQAIDKQKVCNLCHSGCLDCHYTPSREEGVHSFSRRPPASNCAGGGRGTMLCHGGTLERRRGDNYLGGGFTSPRGMEGDVHLALSMDCLDCHPKGEEGMGAMERKAWCSDCHIEAEEALAASVHRTMRCEACHVNRLGGYQQTSWGPGEILKRPNPFKKYSLYYGVLEPPFLMKDQEGLWTPYKVWGNSAGNIRNPVAAKEGVVFRWPDGETRDAYALLGTFDDLPANNLHLAWIQLDQASHPLGKSRSCESCHGGDAQRSTSTWRYYDYQGAKPFEGSHTVVGDREGLRLEDLNVDGEIVLKEGAELSDFAAWTFIGDRWRTTGDFSLPPVEQGKLDTFELQYRLAEKFITEEADRLSRSDLPEKKQKLKRRRLAETHLHNPEMPLPDR